jgi:SsrA-binding protein
MLSIKNRKAYHEYAMIETYEAGIVLSGTEIKSVRQGKVSFTDSYGKIIKDEIWLLGLHISPYEKGTYSNHEAVRNRKLLMHRREIAKIDRKVKEQGMTLVPLELYINDRGLCKVKIAIAKGKHTYDKKDDKQMKDLKRESERAVKNFGKR